MNNFKIAKSIFENVTVVVTPTFGFAQGPTFGFDQHALRILLTIQSKKMRPVLKQDASFPPEGISIKGLQSVYKLLPGHNNQEQHKAESV